MYVQAMYLSFCNDEMVLERMIFLYFFLLLYLFIFWAKENKNYKYRESFTPRCPKV